MHCLLNLRRRGKDDEKLHSLAKRKVFDFVLSGPMETFWEVAMLFERSLRGCWQWTCRGRQPLRQGCTLFTVTYDTSIPLQGKTRLRCYISPLISSPLLLQIGYCIHAWTESGVYASQHVFFYLPQTGYISLCKGLTYCHRRHKCLYITQCLCDASSNAWFAKHESNACRGNMRISEELNRDDAIHDQPLLGLIHTHGVTLS